MREDAFLSYEHLIDETMAHYELRDETRPRNTKVDPEAALLDVRSLMKEVKGYLGGKFSVAHTIDLSEFDPNLSTQ